MGINFKMSDTLFSRAGPRDVDAGGALRAEVLNRAAKAARGGV